MLSNGRLLLADCVVLAVGSMPNTRWLRGSGLVVDDGVLCESTCHAVGATDVVAAGDVARWPNLRFDGVPRRVEHWLNAVEMGRAAAANLLAGRGRAEPCSPRCPGSGPNSTTSASRPLACPVLPTSG